MQPVSPRTAWVRTLLIAVLALATGILVGEGIPALSAPARRILAAIGFAPATERPPENAAPPPKASSPEHGDEREGAVRMSAEQITGQGIGVAAVDGGTLYRHVLVPGTITVDADRIARVPARVVGTVTELRKRLGDRVEQGEMVALLDSREVADAKSDYLLASVQAELQKTNFDRQQKLLTSQATSVVSFDQARATFLDTKLRVDLARQKLSALGLDAAEVQAAAKRDDNTPNLSTLRVFPLRSPLAGRIVERKVDVGTAVGKEGDPAEVYTVADLSAVWIELAVPTVQLAQVKEGARVTVLARQGEAAPRGEGQVIFVSPLLNLETRSARVIVALPNPELAWRPGTFVTAEVEIAQDHVAVRVPKTALQTVEGRRVVFVRTPEGFTARDVELGQADDDWVEAKAGLQPGEEIAVTNTFLLKAELGKADAGHDD